MIYFKKNIYYLFKNLFEKKQRISYKNMVNNQKSALMTCKYFSWCGIKNKGQ